MKTLLTLLILFTSLSSFAQNGNRRAFDTASNPTVIKLENNTGSIMHVCYAYYSNTEQCWISRGWMLIFIYSDITIPLPHEGLFYVLGKTIEGNKVKTWGNDKPFCVNDDVKSKFKILQADEVNCKTKRRFDLVQISQGLNTYRFNP